MTHVTLTRKRELIWVSPDNIVANDNNPRSEQAFTPDELVSLRRSIMTHGVLEEDVPSAVEFCDGGPGLTVRP